VTWVNDLRFLADRKSIQKESIIRLLELLIKHFRTSWQRKTIES